MLSALDLSFVTTGTPGAAAIRSTVDLAQALDVLGYHRFWVAEHHNLPSVASGAPEVMIAAIAAATRRLRVGSGGVMLPNHVPLMVAERFKVLEALHPGRIDLGIGRAPGTDPVASYALRRHQDERGHDPFLDRFGELLAWRDGFPADHAFRTVRVMPEDVALPPIWLLGSSDYSADLAAEVGLGFAFAHHFASHDAADALLRYRRGFRPSAAQARPHAILATAVVCAATDAEAEHLAGTLDLSHLRRSRGRHEPLPSPEEAAAHRWTADEDAARLRNRERIFVGGPARVRDRLGAFAQAVQADEIMVTTAVHDPAARRRSYTLLAEAFALAPTARAA